MFNKQFSDLQSGCAFAGASVATVRRPIVVLGQDLPVIVASRSFYRTFKVDPNDTKGHLLYELGNGEWHIPELRSLLKRILPNHAATEADEIDAHEIEFRVAKGSS